MATFWFQKTHEYIAEIDGDYRVGISEFAAQELGDITFIELPEVGAAIAQGESFGTVESVKAVSDVYAPVDLEVTAVNEELADEPEKVNADPQGDGWFIKVKLSNPSQLGALMSKADYDAMNKEAG
ncbi:glycine cleavage system protein GcvH [bacterium]|nr:glycine cleavage system protein GcvH [bacterium]